jgi:hypothetical protein
MNNKTAFLKINMLISWNISMIRHKNTFSIFGHSVFFLIFHKCHDILKKFIDLGWLILNSHLLTWTLSQETIPLFNILMTWWNISFLLVVWFCIYFAFKAKFINKVFLIRTLLILRNLSSVWTIDFTFTPFYKGTYS